MRNAPHPDISQSKPDWSPINNVAIGQSQKRSFDFFRWWYRLSAPVEPPANASFIRREGYRQARLFSNVAFFLITAFVCAIPICFFLSNPYMLSLDFAEIAITCVSLYLNRTGRIRTAGIVQVVLFEVTLTFVIVVMIPLSGASIQVVDLFIVGELLAVLLLPVGYVFLVALYNSLFIWLNVSYLSYIDMIPALHPRFISLMVRTVGLQFMVASISAICVYNITKAIRHADKAETVAKLEHTLVELRKELQSGIEQILQTHVSIANGNLSARVQLTEDHILWDTARALNRLLVRLQRASVSERELHRVEHAVTSTVDIIQKSAQQDQQARIPFTQTAIDPLVAAIQGKTFAFTKPLRQQRNLSSTDPINRHTVNVRMSPGHYPP